MEKSTKIIIAVLVVIVLAIGVYAIAGGSSVLGSPAVCSDSDGGKNPDVYGIVTFGAYKLKDVCSGTTSVKENYCKNNNTSYGYEAIKCSAGKTCSNGACISGNTTTNSTIKCSINTNCGNPITNKYCSGSNACTNTTTPICNNPGTTSSYCSISGAGGCGSCTYGCSNGVCVNTSRIYNYTEGNYVPDSGRNNQIIIGDTYINNGNNNNYTHILLVDTISIDTATTGSVTFSNAKTGEAYKFTVTNSTSYYAPGGGIYDTKGYYDHTDINYWGGIGYQIRVNPAGIGSVSITWGNGSSPGNPGNFTSVLKATI